MEKRRIFHSDVICLYIAVLCLVYKDVYTHHMYYDSYTYDMFDIFFKGYVYATYQVFFFCLLKPVGSMVGRRFPLLGISGRVLKIILGGLLALYVILLILFETSIFPFRFFMSPVRYICNFAFAVCGFLFGLKKNKDEEWLYYLYGKKE